MTSKTRAQLPIGDLFKYSTDGDGEPTNEGELPIVLGSLLDTTAEFDRSQNGQDELNSRLDTIADKLLMLDHEENGEFDEVLKKEVCNAVTPFLPKGTAMQFNRGGVSVVVVDPSQTVN
jgi:hypothetical protein